MSTLALSDPQAHLTRARDLIASMDPDARAPLARFEAQTEALLHRPDRTALLAEIRVPTLVLCGAEDAWSPLARHQQMAARIAGATLLAVPDSGHMVTMERPAEVTQALAAWLAA